MQAYTILTVSKLVKLVLLVFVIILKLGLAMGQLIGQFTSKNCGNLTI